MSGVLLDQAIAFVRASFTKADVATVDEYGGEFSSAEIGKVSFNCPCIFITVLGFSPLQNGKHVSGRTARLCRLAAFVVTKGATRKKRMRQAMDLSERLAVCLRGWVPANDDTTPFTVGALEDDATAENLYSRAVDEAGLAVWLVNWEQGVKPTIPLPALADWLTLEMHNTARVPGPVPAPPAPAPGVVVTTTTDEIIFPPN
jgi:phage gp37-like protein